MNCSGQRPPAVDARGQTTVQLSVKVSILGGILLLVVFGNIAIVRHFSRQRKKWSASDCLVRALGFIGLLTGLVNVTVYMFTLILGKWIMGEAVCQVHGVVSTMLVSSWTWVLAIAALERFTKLLMPSEHNCLFSEVNTKIIIWGTVLLLLVLYIAPIYGWGEYSFFRGKLDLLVAVKNFSRNAGPRSTTDDVPTFTQQLYAYMWQTRQSSEGALVGITLHLTGTGEITTRQPQFTAAGLNFPLRVSTREMLHCLWTDYRQGVLSDDLTHILLSNATQTALGVSSIDIQPQISPTDYVFYEEVFITMQESSTCGLDYSDVNAYAHSFVIFSWTCTIIAPAILTLYCYIRVFTAGVNNLCFLSADGRTPEDARSAKVFACCSAMSFSCDVPYFVSNLVAGLGYVIPPTVSFTSTVLLFFRCSVLFMLCWLSGCLTSCGCRQCPPFPTPRVRSGRKSKPEHGRYRLQEVKEGLLSAGSGCNNSTHDSPSLSTKATTKVALSSGSEDDSETAL